MKYNFDEVINRRGTWSYTGDSFPEGTIHLGLADMDFQTAQPIIDAMHRIADFRLYGYTSDSCAPEFAEAIIRWWKKHFDVTFRKNELIYTPGVLPAMSCAIEAFTHPGDGVIIQRPVYGPFNGRILQANRQVTDNHLILNKDGRWTIDFADLEEKCADPHNRAMLLCSPANPVGRVWTKEELEKIWEITHRHHVLLVSDEIHADLVWKGYEQTSIWNAAREYDNVIMISGINKTFNVAGTEPSFVAIRDPFLYARFKKAFGWHDPTPFAIGAMIAGYTEGEEWLEQVKDYIEQNLDFSISVLKEKLPWVKVFRPEGTYCLWMNFEECGLSGEEIQRRIKEDARVIGSEGTRYDPALDKWCRFCIPVPRAVLKEAWERIADAFSDIVAG